MFIGRVVGNIVSTSKISDLVGKKLLIVQPMTPLGERQGMTMVAVDTVGSGIGEGVLVTTGSSARMSLDGAGVDSAIVAIIDSIEVEN